MVGLMAQLVMLPILGFLLASTVPMSPELAVGMVLLTACPGEPTSNLITYLARGNVALSISLTALSSGITVLTIPLVINLATGRFLGEATTLQLPFLATMIQIAVITLIPVGLGMAMNSYRTRTAAQIERGVKWLSLFLLGVIVAGLLIQQRASILDFLQPDLAIPAAIYSLLMFGTGLTFAAWKSTARRLTSVATAPHPDDDPVGDHK